MATESRKYTRRLLEAVDEQFVSAEEVLKVALNYLSEAQVQDLVESDYPELCDPEETEFDEDED